MSQELQIMRSFSVMRHTRGDDRCYVQTAKCDRPATYHTENGMIFMPNNQSALEGDQSLKVEYRG